MSIRYIIITLLSLLTAVHGWSDTNHHRDNNESSAQVQDAIVATHTDIKAATEALNAFRTKVVAERTPLVKQRDQLEQSVRELRKRHALSEQIKHRGEEGQATLVQDIESLEEECRFIYMALSEYRRAMETRATTAESILLSDAFAAIDDALTEENEYQQMPDAAKGLLDLSLNWNADRIGGWAFEGTALDQDGREIQGRFAVFGPQVVFATKDGDMCGLPMNQSGTLSVPLFLDISSDSADAITAITEGDQGMAPVDLTGGAAFKLAAAETSLLDHIKKGGFVMIPLLLIGALAIFLAIWKAIDLRRLCVHDDKKLQQVVNAVRADHIDKAQQIVQTMREPLASLVAEGIEHRSASREHMEEVMYERVLASVPRLERNLGMLAVFGGVAPLLGLLGTVTGMIHTFKLVTIFGSGDAKLLSGGISEALVTTEFGLAIAIPVLIVHAILARRVRSMLGTLERTATGIVNDLKIRGSSE